MRRCLIAACLLSLLSLAYAQTCTLWVVDQTSEKFASSQEACQKAAEISLAGSAYTNLVVTATPANSTEHWCGMSYTVGGNNYTSADFTLARSSTGECPPTGCAADAGQIKVVNATVGWTRTNNDDDYSFVGGLTPIPASMCSGGCTVNKSGSPRCWVSTTASPEGLYRNSCDIEVTVTASSCTTTSEVIDPMAPDKQCDGTVGYINGKRTCVKSSSSPDPVAPAIAPERYGNPTAGSEPNPTDANNPAGREPTGGNGGNLGGPPSGDAGGNPRGTGTGPGTGGAGGGQAIKVEIPELKDPCGIPGSAPCKIDETGTPGTGGITGAAAGIGTAGSGLMDAVNGVDKPTSLGWSFSVTLPDASCSPFQFWKPNGTWEVNICSNAVVLLLRDMLAWAMAILAAVYVWRGVTSTVRGE